MAIIVKNKNSKSHASGVAPGEAHAKPLSEGPNLLPQTRSPTSACQNIFTRLSAFRGNPRTQAYFSVKGAAFPDFVIHIESRLRRETAPSPKQAAALEKWFSAFEKSLKAYLMADGEFEKSGQRKLLVELISRVLADAERAKPPSSDPNWRGFYSNQVKKRNELEGGAMVYGRYFDLDNFLSKTGIEAGLRESFSSRNAELKNRFFEIYHRHKSGL
jgi:hypothetical protein